MSGRLPSRERLRHLLRSPVSRLAVAGAALALALVVAVALAPALIPTGSTQAAISAEPKPEPGAFRPTEAQWKGLTIAPVQLMMFRSERVTDGNIAIDDDLNTPVFSPYSGRVTKLIAKLGDSVERGAPLFAVEASEFVQAQNDLISALAALRTARSQLSQAQVNEKRAHELFLANGGALKDWQQSQTDLTTAQNNVRSAETALAAVRNRLKILGKTDKEIAALEAQPTQQLDPNTVVVAPITGTVTQRQVGLGQFIQSVSSGASNPVYTIGDLSTVWLIANVREPDAPAMRVGAPVEVRVAAFPDRVFKAKISWVGSAIDPNTHRLPVRADVENLDGALKPMMFATFTIITGESSISPAVPQRAIVYEGSSTRVWLARDDRTIVSRSIRIGRVADDEVEVLEGLAAGDRVVTTGALFIDRAASGD
ncbi:MAG: efflux RND transporter periplasmic adaptor subunit [Alphaproteobacteria bacterium]|nr:efflux RND transporter periplasmic adaptor subunit [Alphaproteobacteria bacterium]